MTLNELQAAWNEQADAMNSWGELGMDEIVAFAQEQVLKRAADIFEGTRAFNFVAADGYANGSDIAAELRYMASEVMQ